MSDAPKWTPPAKVEELYAATSGNKFASINAPTAGAREEKALPEGSAPFQLYSLATPNGQKVGILLEELGINYDAHFINIGKGDQFTSGFVGVNPNSKIPAALDKEGPDGKPINLFESASIMMYLAEKHNQFIPTNPRARVECMNWLFWQMGGFGPFCGQFGHFFVYAPDDKAETKNYGSSRYGMEVQRLCDVLDKHLADHTYLAGEEYSIADMSVYPWFNQLLQGYPHPSGIKANEFLSVEEKYKNAVVWAERIRARPAVMKGITVCSAGKGKPWLEEEESKK